MGLVYKTKLLLKKEVMVAKAECSQPCKRSDVNNKTL
jgi:hypothetical protein